MKISTLSIVVGGTACNASCPFCVSRMTGSMGVPDKAPEPNWHNLHLALQFAFQSGVSTILLTGKGEPLIWPEQIDQVLMKINCGIPFREIQTNGVLLAKPVVNGEYTYGFADQWLPRWKEQGLSTISLSVVGSDSVSNGTIYTPHSTYPALEKTIAAIHRHGLAVRLSVMMAKGYIDCYARIVDMIRFAKRNQVEQLTVRAISKPGSSVDAEAESWVDEHFISPEEIAFIKEKLDGNAVPLLRLPHGAVVYDYQGQNVCLNNCLTESTDPENIRQLIYFLSDGSLRYSWQYAGARIL